MATSPDEALLVLRAQFGDREDLIQDVLFLIYRKLGGLQNADVFKPWAFRIASRAAFRHCSPRCRPPATPSWCCTSEKR